jgi:hypothetical protein
MIPVAPKDGPLEVVVGRRRVLLPALAGLLLTREQRAERERLLAGRYFLVSMRLGDVGEIFRCGRCNGKHDRLTRYCIERPFAGLYGGLYAYVKTLGEAAESGVLTPRQHLRYQAIAAAVAGADPEHPPPDLAASHPRLARALGATATTDAPKGPNDVDLDIGMVSLGLCERIEPADAQRLLDRINTRAHAYRLPPLVVPGLRVPRTHVTP